MTDHEKINGWTFEETVKTAENLMESEQNIFKRDVLRHIRDFAENYKHDLEQYTAIGTPEECREAVPKQKPKKPIRNDRCTCPLCGTHNEVFKKRRNTVARDVVYCWHCGQAVEIDRLE